MKKVKIVHPDRDPDFDTGAYSDAIVCDGFLYTSGQASVDFATSKFDLGTIEEETIKTLDNIKAIIEVAGGALENILKCTVHLSDINNFDRFNTVYASYFEGIIPPARTTVQSILAENLKVEIDVVVKLPKI
jgi:2-iminobutanoate/2-iminopropanoate deaminase